MPAIKPDLTNEQEVQLLARARRFELDALGRIHDVYYPFLYRYISFRVGDCNEAEDLTSEVFRRWLAALRSGRAPEATLAGWLYRVAGHVVQDHHRQQGRYSESELPDSVLARDPSSADTAEPSMLRAGLHQAVAELTDEQQSVIALRFGDGLPIQDVARLVGKSEGAVKQLQARAVAQLARRMTMQVAE